MADNWVTIPETDKWEPIDDWETIPEEPGTIGPQAFAFGKQIGGALVKGTMRTVGAYTVGLPGRIVQQVKLIPMSAMADEVLAARDPKQRAAKLKDMSQVEGFFNKVTKELDRAYELHKIGQATIIKNHPEWESKPPKSFVDLLTSPDKLVIALAESVPLLLSAGIMTAAGQPNIAAMMMYGAEGEEARNRAKLAGASDEDAEMAYALYAPIAAVLETLQLRHIMKIGKGMWGHVLNRTAQKVGRKGAKALTMEVIKVAGKEALEEMAQGTWGDVTAKIVYNEPFGSVGKFVDQRAQEGYIGFTMGLVAAGGGAAVGRAQRAVTEPGVVEEIKPDKVKFKATVYKGKAAAGPVDAGVLGKGTYYSTSKETAKSYGPIAETKKVTLNNPFYAESEQQVTTIAEDVAIEQDRINADKPLNIRTALREEAVSNAIRERLEAQGYDGIVLNRGKAGKEVVVFESAPTTADEAIGKQYGLVPGETNERLGKAELRYRELKNKPIEQRTRMEKKELAFLKRSRKNIEAILERETQPLEKTMSRKKALALGHQIPEQLGWTEDQRRDFNKRITNRKSMKGMSPAQRQQIINALTKEAKKAGIETEISSLDTSPVGELMLKLEERKQKPALTSRDRRNMKKLRKVYYIMKSKTNFYFLHMSRMKRLCHALDNYEDDGPFTKYIYQPVKDADTQAAVNFTETMEAAQATFRDLKIDVVPMFTEVKDVGIDDKLSTAERIGVWALAQNKKTRNHLRSEFNEVEIDKIVKSVEANEKEMLVAAEIQTYFEIGWDQLKTIATAHGIKGIIKEENYITAFVKNKQDVTETEFMEGLLQEFTQGKFVPGEQHMIERKPGARRDLELNVFMIHARAAKAIERFKVMALVADKVGQMLKHGGFKENINNASYGHGSRLFDKWLQDSIRGRSTYDTSAIGQALRWLRMKSVHYVLGAKVLTAAKQGISLFPAMGVHPGMVPLILANIAHNPFGAKYKAMEAEVQTKSKMMRHRDWDRDLRQTYDQKAVKKMYAGKKLSPLLMRMATWVDRHTAGAVWHSAYHLSLKHGMNEKESIRFADGVVENTQPMGKAVDLPAFFRGSELEKNLTIFQNQVNQNGNMLWYDTLGETKTRKISIRMLGYRLLMQQLIPALLLGMVSRGRLPRDLEDISKDLAFYLLSPYFFIGRTLYNMFIAREWGPTTGFIWETPITETWRATGAAMKGEPGKMAKYGARAVGAWTGGYPPLQVLQTVEGGWNLATGETDDFRELVWSKYALKTKRKERGAGPSKYK